MWRSFCVPVSSNALRRSIKRISVTNRLKRVTVNVRVRMRMMAISIGTLLQASRSFFLRVLRDVELALLVCLCLAPIATHAQDAVWSPPVAGSSNWNDGANWTGTVVPPTGTAIFGSSNTTTITFLSPPTSIGGLLFNVNALAYTFNISGDFTINAVGIVNNSSNSPTFTSPSGANNTLNFAGVSATAGNATINAGPNLVTTFHGTSTAGSATIINTGGTTQFFDTSTAGNSTIINNSGGNTQFSFTMTGSMSTAGAATIINNFDGRTGFSDLSTAGTASITNNLRGTTTFFASSTAASSTITTNSGGLTLFVGTSTGGQARFITNAGGIVDISGLTSAGMTAGSIEGAGTYFLGSKALTVGLNNFNTEVSGAIDDGPIGPLGALIKVGAGTLMLTGPNGYSGGTSFDGGTVTVLIDANLGTGPLSFNGGTLQALVAGGGITSGKAITLNTDGGTFLADAGTTSTLSGVISGTGSLMKDGPGNLVLSGQNTYGGGTSFDDGILAVNSDANLGTGALSFNGGTLEALMGGGITSSKAITLNALGGTFLADANTTSTLSGAITGVGAFTKDGAGILVLSGASTYSGVTTVSAGMLQAGSSTAFSPNSAFTVNSVLNLTGFSNTVGSLAGSGTVTNNGSPAILTAGGNGTNTVFSGTLINGTASLGLIKAGPGTLTLSGANTYTGGTTITGGTLKIGNGGTTGSIVGNVVDNGSLVFNRSDAITFPGIVSGTGSLSQTGPGSLTLTAANTYSGGTVIDRGTLLVDNAHALGTGNVTVNGGILAADPQPINVKGNYTQNAGGTLQLNVAGGNPGQYDTLNVGGSAALGGTLKLISLGFQPKAGDALTLVTSGGVVSGRFAQFINPFATGPGFTFAGLVYEPDAVLLEFRSAASFALTANQLAAARLLDAVHQDPSATNLISFLSARPLAICRLTSRKSRPMV
jgi:autotransporter-associated beta strand protein